MRKQLLCIMLAAGLAVGMTACGGDSSAGAKDAAAQEETTAGEKDNKEEKEEKEKKEEKEEKETTEKETAKETTPEETEVEEEFQTGTWDGLTFSNPWLGMTITFPEDSHVLSESEMQEILGAGQDILVNNGNFTEAQLKIADVTTVYDFMVALPDGQSNIQLAYENINITTMGRGISEADYLDVLSDQLTQIADMQYELGEKEEAEIAGQTFTKIHASVMGGVMYQDYYCIRKGGHMATMTISYLPDCQESVDEIIAGITAVQ